MGRLFNIWYATFLLGVLALFALGRVNDGKILIMSFEGDAIHMAQIALRMAAGEVPSVDFQTPLGVLAFLPITQLMSFGFSIGAAFAYAPVIMALLCLPAVFWIGITRFHWLGALGFGAVFLTMFPSLLHGGLKPTVTMAMYYNNWCWAVSMLAIVLAVLPSTAARRMKIFEALVLGIAMGFLVLTKATFAVFLTPALVVALLMQGRHRVLLLSVLAALAFMSIVTLPYGGIGYWMAYIEDLRTVASSPLRARPTAGVVSQAMAPAYIVGTVLLLLSVVLLRQARRQADGLVLLLLGGGWALITYQNWQSDPHWFVLAGLLLFPLSKGITLYNQFDWPIRSSLHYVAVAFLAIGVPLTYTQIQSVLVHNGLDQSQYEPGFQSQLNSDMWFQKPSLTGHAVTVENPFFKDQSPDDGPTFLNGEMLPECQGTGGLYASMAAMGSEMDKMSGTKGKSAIVADWGNGVWLFSDLVPVSGAAPWYYGGTPGFDQADYVIVPLCPSLPANRKLVLAEIENDTKGVEF